LYTRDLHNVLWRQLADQGQLLTCYLGQRAPASLPGQKPPGGAGSLHRQRLIGPLLDPEPENTLVVVLANGPVRDLADFRSTTWKDRLVLVRLDPDANDTWPGWIQYRDGDDPAQLVGTIWRQRFPTMTGADAATRQ
jgi:hypothetical protein